MTSRINEQVDRAYDQAYRNIEKEINRARDKAIESITHQKRNRWIMALSATGMYLVFSVYGMFFLDKVHHEELSGLDFYMKYAKTTKVQERYDILTKRLEANKGITGYLTAGAKTIYWWNPLFGIECPTSFFYNNCHQY
ncbi:MAG: hypothetical protein FWC51_01325 [Proteobacteria bacterium]|nr:hypothetical protein [Pseudomonadota bacterium]